MKGNSSLEKNGLSDLFNQHYWDIVGNDITNMALDILNNNGNVSNLNQTYICLIFKTNKPTNPPDSKPISLCNVTIKIITKIIKNRIKPRLNQIISPLQSSFIPGRLIADNILC